MPNDDPSVAAAWTIIKTLRWTTGFFKKHGIDSARSDAEILMAHMLNCERIDLYLNHDQPLQAQELSRIKDLIRRRIRHEPVAYIKGVKEFWSLEFNVTPDVLIPRPETEGLVEWVLRHYSEKEPIHILELGTGSGIISVVLAHERPHSKIWASDISEKAIEIARINARRHLTADRILFSVGHWFDAISNRDAPFDLIISNPPYISRGDMPKLAPEIYKNEPHLALDGGPDGLACIRSIIHSAHDYMKSAGWLIIEIGFDQGDAVQTLARECGVYDDIGTEKDLSGHDRLVRLRKK